jgi:hypothetical protein
MKLEPYEREFAHLQGLPAQTSSRALLHFPRNLAPDLPHYISGKGFEKMKTFIVYDLDSKMPVAVGEQVSAETARYCASVATGIFEANLLAEEIDLEKQITY